MTRTFLSLIALSYAALLLISIPQLADPLIRFDDFVALFGEEGGFYSKTLSEGRWLNYWWIARPVLWSPTVNFMAYQLGWAIFAAGAALNALGPNARPLRLGVLAVIIALSPQAFLISGWFNTLILGIWLVAIYATLSIYVSAKTGRVLFLIMSPISMMAYSTYPFLLFAMCLTRYDARLSFGRLIGLVLMFGFSIGLGMLLMYSMNYYAHGIFGIELADGRKETSAAAGIADLLANARDLLPPFLEAVFSSSGFGIASLSVLNLLLLMLSLAVLLIKRPIEALYFATGLGLFAGLLALHGIKEGIAIPERAMIGAWVLFAIALIRAAEWVRSERHVKLADAGLILAIAIYGGHLFKNADFFTPWQAETRSIAAQIPDSAEQVYVFGHVGNLVGVAQAHIDHPVGLTGRLRVLKGVQVHPCGMLDYYGCSVEAPFDLATGSEEILIEMKGVDAYIRLPSTGTDTAALSD